MPAAGSSSAKGCVFVKNNHLRMILCLFMCCLLLFTCVSRPAAATEVAVVAGLAAIPVAVAVATAFQALGVMSASNSTAFTTTVDNCTNWLTQNTDFVVNGAVALLGLTQDGARTSYLSKNFVQTVWEWLFSSKTVQRQEVQLETTYYPSSDMLAIAMAAPYSVLVYYTINATSPYRFFFLCYSNYPITVRPNNTSTGTGIYIASTQSKGAVYYATRTDTSFNTAYGLVAQGANDMIVSVQRIGSADPISYQTSDNLSLGSIESPFQTVGTEEETIQIEIAPIYIDWTKYGVPDPNDPGGDDPDNDGKFPMWLPTGIPSPGYDDSVITQNQQQAQSGVVSGDITFEPYVPDSSVGGGGGAGTGTDLSSVIQAIGNVPTAIVNGIGDLLSNFFGFNRNYEDYMVRLRDFFPFCIPFDLYDFITVLSAEPEAPVFHWEIPVPQLGQTFELEVDLSAWDDIALLFRNLELLAFIFGLAIITREKFLRS